MTKGTQHLGSRLGLKAKKGLWRCALASTAQRPDGSAVGPGTLFHTRLQTAENVRKLPSDRGLAGGRRGEEESPRSLQVN